MIEEELKRQLNQFVNRISFAKNIREIREQHQERTNARLKSKSLSEKYRNAGNRAFLKRQNAKALQLYNKALQYCPANESLSCMKVLGNRSAVLCEMGPGKVHDAILNINTALSMMDMKRDGLHESDVAALKSKLLRRMEKFSPELISQKEESTSGSWEEEEPMSSKLQVRTSSSAGRFVVTKEDVFWGDVLFHESPFASVLQPEYEGQFCHHCIRTLSDSPFFCSSCSDVQFCSPPCSTQSWKEYHQWECPILSIVQNMGLAHLALRAALIHCVGNNNAENDVLDLQHHGDKMEKKDVVEFVRAASICSGLVYGSVDLLQKQVSLENLAWMILRLIFQLISNAHGIVAVLSGEEGGIEQLRQRTIGCAIYQKVSMMNHACRPNIINCFQGRTLVVRALSHIPTGHEVLNSYGPHSARHPLQMRQEQLKQQYFFTCHCQECESEAVTGHWFLPYQCPSCSYTFDEAKLLEAEQWEKDDICPSCHSRMGIFQTEWVKSKEEAKRLTEVIWRSPSSEWSAEDVSSMKHTVGVFLSELRPRLNMKHPLRGEVADAMAQVALVKFENIPKALDILRDSMQCVVSRFGEKSPEFSHELLKFLDVLTLQIKRVPKNSDTKEFFLTLETAETLFKRIYGENKDNPWLQKTETIRVNLVNSLGSVT